ncbi:MAG: metal-dependent hydrolase [Nitrospirota bacterium]|nr:metal-dependent hydrolase [Nitrospirota bacterium]MDH5767937.1 metal-dependent hydrolase [Nitrospirota bacterium]
MDPITHGLAGVTITNLGFNRKAAFLVILLSALAPDIDYVTRLWGADVFLRYHRGITHGILALFIVPVIIGLIFGLRKGFFYYFFIAFLSYSAHLFMDLTTQYGTRILSPLDWEPYSLNLMFIIDPYVTIGLLLSVIFCVMNKKRAILISIITVVLLASYTGGRYYLYGKTKEFLKERIEANTYTLCPLPNDFLRWWFVVMSGNEFKVGFADLFTGRICVHETYKVHNNDPFIEMSKKEGVVRNFLYFAKHPYVEVKRGDKMTTVTWRELSFTIRPEEHFVAKVFYDKEGKVITSYFKF